MTVRFLKIIFIEKFVKPGIILTRYQPEMKKLSPLKIADKSFEIWWFRVRVLFHQQYILGAYNINNSNNIMYTI